MKVNNENLTFKARCPQIRFAQDVSLMVKREFPHIAPTRVGVMVDSFGERHPEQYSNWQKCPIACRQAIFKNLKNKAEQKIYNMLLWFDKIRFDLGFYNCKYSTPKNEKDIVNALNNLLQMKNGKLANCHENAKAGMTILKMNGVENAQVVQLKMNDQPFDHCVCVFNKDGSEFAGKEKQTIVVDPWMGVADFADNYFTNYSSELSKLSSEPLEGKFDFIPRENYEFDKNDIELLKSEFPNLIIRN